MSYVRGESKFSDHRPVYSLFSVQVNLPLNEIKTTKPKGPNTLKSLILPACVAIFKAEELVLSKTKSCIESTPRFSAVAKKLTSH